MLLSANPVIAQISPGQLASVHSNLEGISNCTHCHTLGDKVTNDKCLSCHTELKARLDLHKGYHASSEVPVPMQRKVAKIAISLILSATGRLEVKNSPTLA
ncbi:MAG: hypothetical protein NTW31_04010 [Bacteroidetes bacterium]|nr:hypothetical protein [Bacteroidota bacterium]